MKESFNKSSKITPVAAARMTKLQLITYYKRNTTVMSISIAMMNML